MHHGDHMAAKRKQNRVMRKMRQLFGPDFLNPFFVATVSPNSDPRSLAYAISYTVSFRSTGNLTFEVLACKTKEKSAKEENDTSKNYWTSKVVSPGDEDVCDIMTFGFRKTGLSISLKGGEVLRVSPRQVRIGDCYGRII